MAVRLLKTIGLHLLLAALAAGAIWMVIRGQSMLDATFLQEQVSRVAIERMIGRLRSAMLVTEAIALGISCVAACVWVFIAERADPAANAEARRYTPAWATLFLIALAGIALAAWIGLWRMRLTAMIDPGALWIGMALIALAVVLGYLLSTSLTAPPKLRVAVPLAEFFFRMFRPRKA